MYKEMEMPTPCQKCGEWFDLNDGYASYKWFPNTVICENCHELEEREVEIDEEIRDLEELIEDAQGNIQLWNSRLKELKELQSNF